MKTRKQSLSTPGAVGVAVVDESVTVKEFVQISEHVRLYIVSLLSSSDISRMKCLAMRGAMNAPKDQLK